MGLGLAFSSSLGQVPLVGHLVDKGVFKGCIELLKKNVSDL